MKKSRSPRSTNPGIIVRYERKGRAILGFDVAGHAGFAAAGRDIVCAGVSALVLSTAYGLRRHCGFRTKVTDTPACYALRLAGVPNACSQALLATMLAGLKAIARSYPGYIKVRPGEGMPQGSAVRTRNRNIPTSST